jgi:hypothetical protein
VDVHYCEIPVAGPGLTEYLRILATTRPVENTVVHRFRWLGDRIDWFKTTSNLDTYATFRQLLESAAAQRAMPKLLVPSPFPNGSPPEFYEVGGGALDLDGVLAKLLVLGGAYERFQGPHVEAKALAAAAVYDLIQDRYEDFSLYYSDHAWSPWFFYIAWDLTFILVDRRQAEVTIIATTDTD